MANSHQKSMQFTQIVLSRKKYLQWPCHHHCWWWGRPPPWKPLKPSAFFGSREGHGAWRGWRGDVGWAQLGCDALSPPPGAAFADATTTVSHEGESPDGSQGCRQPDIHPHNRMEIRAGNIYTRPLLQKINPNHAEWFEGAQVLFPTPTLLKG